MKNDPIVIVSAARTPIGGLLGIFKDIPAHALASVVIASLLKRAHLTPTDIDAAILGCVLPAGLGQAPARQAALNAKLPVSTDCMTINKVCGSGMKAVMLAHDLLMINTHKIIVAGGMENMTLAPYLLPLARQGYRVGHGYVVDHMLYDGLEDAYQKGHLMGTFAEKCAARYHFSREAQDAYATESLKRTQTAETKGYFSEEIVPIQLSNVTSLNKDEQPSKLHAEKISQLKPAFVKDGTVTAANSSSISDGAAGLILMHASEAKARGITPLAKIVAHTTHSQEPEWFTTAPIQAIQKLFEKTGWSEKDVDLFEINEAFAVVVMAAMKELKLSHDKINVHGGACALGHPIGASGARILVTLIYALKQHKKKRGIASLCIGGGEATAIAIEI